MVGKKINLTNTIDNKLTRSLQPKETPEQNIIRSDNPPQQLNISNDNTIDRNRRLRKYRDRY
jgi:hemerythrin superfamily protein